MEIMELLDRLEEIAQSATRVPLTGKILLDPDDLFDLVETGREVLPTEIREAGRVQRDRESILATAQAQAKQIVEEAKSQAQNLVDEHPIRRQAEDRAQEILNEAYTGRKEIFRTALERVDELFAALEPFLAKANSEMVQVQNEVAKAQEEIGKAQNGVENAQAHVAQWRDQLKSQL